MKKLTNVRFRLFKISKVNHVFMFYLYAKGFNSVNEKNDNDRKEKALWS
jgi:hypothetical protein